MSVTFATLMIRKVFVRHSIKNVFDGVEKQVEKKKQSITQM